MSKPIIIKRVSRGWNLIDNGTPATRGSDGKPSLPGFKNYVADAPACRLPSLEAAQSLAHLIGKYLRKYGGDFVFAYTEVVR